MRKAIALTVIGLTAATAARAADFDLDADGRVTASEIAQSLWQRFREAEVDGDGVLSPAEQESWFKDSAAARQLWDTNGDGSLDSIEWTAAVEMIGRVDIIACDADKDGVLSGDELDCLYDTHE